MFAKINTKGMGSQSNTHLVPCVGLLLSSTPWPTGVSHLKQWSATPLEFLWPGQRFRDSACDREKVSAQRRLFTGELCF